MSGLAEKVKSSLSFLDNQYVAGVLMLVIVLYASLAAPQLPPYIAKLFEYNLVRLIICFLILYVSIKDVSIALVLAIAFIVSIQTLNRISAEEQLKQWLFMSREQRGGQAMPEQVVTMDDTAPQVPIARPEFGPDSGFEFGSAPSGCYGATTGLQGYDSAGDKLSEY